MGREDLAGVEGDDRDLLLVDDGQDPPSGIDRAGIEMVEATGAAQGDGALAVRDVVAQAEVAPSAGAGRQRLGRRAVGRAGRGPPDRPVRPLLVVGAPEGVELGLERGQACALPAGARASA